MCYGQKSSFFFFKVRFNFPLLTNFLPPQGFYFILQENSLQEIRDSIQFIGEQRLIRELPCACTYSARGVTVIDARQSVLQELVKSLLIHRVTTNCNSPFSVCTYLRLQLETVNKHQRQVLLPQITNKHLTPPPQSPFKKCISIQINAKFQHPITQKKMPQILEGGDIETGAAFSKDQNHVLPLNKMNFLLLSVSSNSHTRMWLRLHFLMHFSIQGLKLYPFYR